MGRTVLLLFVSAAIAGATDWRLSGALDTGAGFRPWWCQSSCVTNSEILYDDFTGAGTCDQVWSQAPDGSHRVNLSSTLFTGGTTKNQGAPMYSPDGAWILLTMQSNSSALACFGTNSAGGGGIDNDIYVCKVSGGACTKLTNTTIDGTKGYLRPRFTRDAAKVYVMKITGQSQGGASIGVLTICGWNPATPALTSCADSSPVPQSGTYEAGDSDPTVTPTCVLYFTGSGQTLNNYRIWEYDSCAQTAPVPLTDFGIYAEFWSLTPRGDIALFTSPKFTPNTQIVALNSAFDLAMADAKTGQNQIPLTCFNTPGASDFDAQFSQVTVGPAAWSPDGKQFILSIAKGAQTSHLWRYNFTASAVAP